MNLSFIGLGNMGQPMALNLVRAGFKMKIFDKDLNKGKPLLDAGANWSDSSVDAVGGVDVVMTSLPGPEEIEDLALGEGNILDAMTQGAIWIDFSTNNLNVEQKIREVATIKGVQTLDAPVSGGIEGARDGNLVVLVGGEKDVFEKCKVIFDTIGEDVKYLGGHGTGYVAKIAQVVLCYLHSVALSEALMLGVKGGVNASTMLGIIQNSTGRSYVADRYGPPILEGSYDPGFTLGLAHKDMKLTLELAESVDATLPMCQQVESIYAKAVSEYGLDQNHLMAVKLLEEQNNTFLREK